MQMRGPAGLVFDCKSSAPVCTATKQRGSEQKTPVLFCFNKTEQHWRYNVKCTVPEGRSRGSCARQHWSDAPPALPGTATAQHGIERNMRVL